MALSLLIDYASMALLKSGTHYHLTLTRLIRQLIDTQRSNCTTSHTVNTLTSLRHHVPPIYQLRHIGAVETLFDLQIDFKCE